MTLLKQRQEKYVEILLDKNFKKADQKSVNFGDR